MGGPQCRDGRVVGVVSCAKAGGGSVDELVYPPTGVETDRRTTSEYEGLSASNIPGGAVTTCGVP